MPEMTLICTCCGLKFTLPAGKNLQECPACGTPNARPQVEGASLEVLERAIAQRHACDFANAEESYQQVLRGYPNNHEALWGNLLCQYGVEYVTDPKTNKLLPVVHAVRRSPMKLKADFKAACRNAPEEIRARYMADADYIDQVQTRIRALAEKNAPYDVFLCHKTTKPNSAEKTKDYDRASDLYHYLDKLGVKVFFAPKSLPGMAGANYEAAIYHALHTARFMLVVCSEPEYLNSAWVRSEWSRYLELVDEGEDKRLIPLFYGDFKPQQQPEDFLLRSLEGISMESPTAMPNLLKSMGMEPTPTPGPTPTPKPQPTPAPKPAQEPTVIRVNPPQGLNASAPMRQTTIELPPALNTCPGLSDCSQCPQYPECAKRANPKIQLGKGKRLKVRWHETITTEIIMPTQVKLYQSLKTKTWVIWNLINLLFLAMFVAGLAGELVELAIAGVGCFGYSSLLLLLSCVATKPLFTFTALPGKKYQMYYNTPNLKMPKLKVLAVREIDDPPASPDAGE